MDKVGIDLNNEEFEEAFKQYAILSSKKVAESVNDKAIDLCIKAGKSIEKGEPYQKWPKGHRIYHILAAGGNRRKNGESLETRFGKAPKGKGNKKLANKIAVARNKSKNYSKAICFKLATELGAQLRSFVARSGKIKYANAQKAKWQEYKPKAYLDVEGLEKDHVDDVMQPAFTKALPIVAKDMQKYIDRKLREAAKKHSGKKR